MEKKKLREGGTNLNRVQNILHGDLYSFINGGSLTKKSKILYPFYDEVYSRLKDESVLSSKGNAEMLASGYKKLSRLTNRKTTGRKVQVKVGTSWKRWVQKSRDDLERYVYLKKLRELRRAIESNLKDYLLDVVLMGSFSSLDFCENWSDLDILFVIKKEVIEDPQKLIELRRKTLALLPYVFYYDPLQHHGFFVITEQDLEYYPQNYFPFVLFRKGVSLLGEGDGLIFKERECSEENKKQFEGYCTYITEAKLKESEDAYEYKNFLHTLFMLPVAYLQLKDKTYRDKKEAIHLAKRRFSKKMKGEFEEISTIRERWRYKSYKLLFGLSLLLKNPYVYHYMHKYGKRSVNKEVTKQRREVFMYAKELVRFLKKDLAGN